MAVIRPIPPQRATPAGSAPVQDAGHDLAAPMAGTVVSIEVTPGQQVGAGEVLCVLEAMKMKNPLRSPAAGTVTEIVAQAGQSVAYGDVLVRLS